METLKNSPIQELIAELSKNGPGISKEAYEKAEKEINEKMEAFAIEQRAYFAMSVESSRKAYINTF